MKEKRSAGELLRRYLVFVVALFVMAMGVSLSIRANLGSSPISAPPYVLSLVPNAAMSMGGFTICMHVLFILTQILVLRSKYQKIQLLQLAVGFLYGFYTDLTMWITSPCQWGNSTTDYIIRLLQLFMGATLLAYGIAIEVRCNVLLLAGEGLPSSISQALNWDFGKVKICTDTFLVGVAVVFSFVFFGSWRWDMIGVGTLFSMIAVGLMVRFFASKIVWVDKFFIPAQSKNISEPIPAKAEHSLVITISRYYGSGGHELGELLSKEMGIAFYDMNIVNQTAQDLGYTFDFVKEKEQNISNAKLLELVLTDSSIPKDMHYSEGDKIFVAQSRIIRSLAAKGDCVVIGRCADYILRDNPNILRVFVKSDSDFAIKRIMQSDNLSQEEAQKKIAKINKGRANQYWQYTGYRWDDASHYDLVIDTSKVGISKAVQIIKIAATK